MKTALVLAGCARYQPMTLPTDERLLRDVAQLRVDTAAMPAAPLRAHVFDPSDGLDMTEVAMLAVVNNLLNISASQNRVRAIAMTTLAASLTLLPLAVAISPGLVVQLPLALLAMPAFYTLLHRERRAPLSASTAVRAV